MNKSFLENSIQVQEDLDISEIKNIQVYEQNDDQESEQYKQFKFLENLEKLIQNDEADL